MPQPSVDTHVCGVPYCESCVATAGGRSMPRPANRILQAVDAAPVGLLTKALRDLLESQPMQRVFPLGQLDFELNHLPTRLPDGTMASVGDVIGITRARGGAVDLVHDTPRSTRIRGRVRDGGEP